MYIYFFYVLRHFQYVEPFVNLMNIICNSYKNAIMSFHFIFIYIIKVLQFHSPFLWSLHVLHVSIWVLSRPPQLSPDMHIRLISNSKLSIGM